MKISVVAPVLNETPWIGYSIMSVLDQIHEFIYIVDEDSNDGTRELLKHIKEKYAGPRLIIGDCPHFHPSDMAAYNATFNIGIGVATGEAIWFLHPDMVVTNPGRIAEMKDGPLAWTTNITSYAGDFQTEITKGRAARWKNIHSKRFGLHYYGAYGSVNEDFYHKDITGRSYRHHGENLDRYPFSVADSGLNVNHYCELKSYKRRLEKMKLCLKTQNPNFDDGLIEELAIHHPRVTLDSANKKFGTFEFTPVGTPIPKVITKYKDEFESFQKELVHG